MLTKAAPGTALWPDRVDTRCVGRCLGRSPRLQHGPREGNPLAGGPTAATIMQTHDLARQTDEELLGTHHREGSLAARHELVGRFMPFARKLAVRYKHSREPMDDLMQVASIGLLNAIDRFDPEHGKKFTAFAAPTILGELKRHFRDKGWTIHVPRDLQERVLAASRHTERLSVELRRAPTPDEFAHAFDCTVKQAVEAIDAGENYQLASLDVPVPHDDEDGSALADMLGVEDNGFELAEDRQALVSQLGHPYPSWNDKYSACASSTGSPSARSASELDTRKCTSPVYFVEHHRGTSGVCMKTPTRHGV
jgi:RNA polymerase sigma-B factor